MYRPGATNGAPKAKVGSPEKGRMEDLTIWVWLIWMSSQFPCNYTIWTVDGATPKRWLSKGAMINQYMGVAPSTFQMVYCKQRPDPRMLWKTPPLTPIASIPCMLHYCTLLIYHKDKPAFHVDRYTLHGPTRILWEMNVVSPNHHLVKPLQPIFTNLHRLWAP